MKNNRRKLYTGSAFLALIGVLGMGRVHMQSVAAQAANRKQAPMFQVDPTWPKPLPNGWLMGNVIGVAIDSKDHIWVVHRPRTVTAKELGAQQNPPIAMCCKAAPPVMEFDEAGNLLRHWGGQDGPGWEWPQSEHGIFIDHKDNVWLGANGGMDSQVLKFSQDGKFLLQIGHRAPNGGSNDTANVGGTADFSEDAAANEIYLADGYRNKRVIVFDEDTGAYKRHWGAYGKKPDDSIRARYDPTGAPSQTFANPVHCAVVANDGFVYVCDRVNDRFQIFKKDGTFVKEVPFMRKTLGDGSVWDVEFSKDPLQKYLYMPDGSNMRIHIFERNSMELLSSFASGGRYPGEFYAVHSLATDSKGNIFTTETYEGRRAQKWIYKGIGPVTAANGPATQ